MNNRLNYILIVLLIVVPAAFGFQGMTAQMVSMIAAIGLGLFFANIDKFQKFKGAGIEAEMRAAVNETYAALAQLQELALSLSAPIIDEMAASGNAFHYIHLKYKLARIRKIEATLKKIGASQTEIDETCKTIYERVREEHFEKALLGLRNVNPDKALLFAGMEDGQGQWDLSTWQPSTLYTLIKENALVGGDDARVWMDDLQYFLQHRELRREDEWQG